MEAVFNKIGVVDTYLNGFDSIGHFTLWEELEPEVRSLAEQHTLVAGESVHIARAMLDTVVEFDGDGLEELRLIKQEDVALTVYPVPANDMLSVSNLPTEQGTLQVYDLTGRIVISRNFSTENQQYSLDLAVLEDGIFLLVVLDLAGEQVGRVLFTKQ